MGCKAPAGAEVSPETAALAMVKRYSDDATLQAVARADQLLEDGDFGRKRIFPGSRFWGKGLPGKLKQIT